MSESLAPTWTTRTVDAIACALLKMSSEAAGLLPVAALLAFLSLPFGVRAARIALRTPADPKRMTQAFANVFGLHFTGGLLLAGSLLFA